MSDELPIGRLLERVAPNIHDSIFDEYGRFAPFWKWSKPKEEEEPKLGYPYEHIEIARTRPLGVIPVGMPVAVPVPVEVEKRPPEIMPEF